MEAHSENKGVVVPLHVESEEKVVETKPQCVIEIEKIVAERPSLKPFREVEIDMYLALLISRYTIALNKIMACDPCDRVEINKFTRREIQSFTEWYTQKCNPTPKQREVSLLLPTTIFDNDMEELFPKPDDKSIEIADQEEIEIDIYLKQRNCCVLQ